MVLIVTMIISYTMKKHKQGIGNTTVHIEEEISIWKFNVVTKAYAERDEEI